MDSGEGFLLGASFVSGVTLVVSWVRQWREIRRLRKTLAQTEKPDDHTRFQRLEHAVDAIAMEVERVSNAQRVVAQMLTDRGGQSAPLGRLAERQTTPH